MDQSVVKLLEEVVERSWEEHQVFSKAVFKKLSKRTDSVCQAISRLVHHHVMGCFPDSYMLEFRVEDKPHIIVYISHNNHNYIVDGTIKQFLPEEEKTVFYLPNYPYQKEISTAKRRLI